MRKATGVFLCIALLWANLSFGQQATSLSGEVSQYTQLQQMLEKLEKEAENIPFNITRVAPQEISYDTTRLTEQGYRLIRHEIERVLRETERVKLLEIEEFQKRDVLRIISTDSTLSLSNTSGTDKKEESIRLLELSQQYGIDAFLKGNIQYQGGLGYVVTLEMISPQSREVLWSTSVVSKEMEPEEEPSGGKLTLISAGASLLPTNGYTINNTNYNGEILFLDYSARLTLRQPINENNGGYIGVRAGYHYYNTLPKGEEESNYDPFTKSVYEVGAIFYKTIGEKTEKENEYWVELYLAPNLLMPSNSQNMFALTQGVNINMSENLGLVLDVQYLLSSDPDIESIEETKNIQLNSIGYGLKLLLRL